MAVNLCRVFFFLGGGGQGGEEGVPCFVKVFSAFLRSFRAYFLFPERCSEVFRVFWKLFRDIPGFLQGVPRSSRFSGTVPGVPGCSWMFRGIPVFRCSVFRCSWNYYMPLNLPPQLIFKYSQFSRKQTPSGIEKSVH